jgi:hypothetical protein
MSLFKLSISAPSFMIGFPALIPSKSALLPIRIPPLKLFPKNDPNAAAPELAKEPNPEARPYVVRDDKSPVTLPPSKPPRKPKTPTFVGSFVTLRF